LHAVVGDFATALPEWQREILLWQQRWIGFVRHDIPVSSRLLRALRAKGVPVFALSIFGLGKLAEVRARFPVLGEFDRQFNSGAPSFIKPDPSIYAGLEGGIGPAGESLIFADDSRACIGAAEAPGWKNAHHFSDPDAWAARLAEEGLLSPMVWEE